MRRLMAKDIIVSETRDRTNLRTLFGDDAIEVV
jgi:hypothetical protein